MTGFEAYNLFICFFVYVLLTLLFSVLIGALVRSQLRLIRAGLEDEQIKQEQEKTEKKDKTGRIYRILPILCCALLTVVFLFSLCASFTQDGRVGKVPTVKVVSSGSMAAKYEQNKYLFENDLNNQLQVFDLIVLHELPAEKDLCLYDIVVYEVGDMHLVHRIVGIEEPNEKHPDEYYFLMQGDNVQYPDKFPVRYSQMRSIYRDQRIPFLGSFVFFMQSPAGALCFLLAVAGVIAAFVIEKKFDAAVQERIAILYPADTTESDGKDAATSSFYIAAQRRSFTEKAEALMPERRAWLDYTLSLIDSVQGSSVRRGKQAVTYLIKGKPLAKITISRGYVYVNLAVDPAEYADKKYGIKDMSSVKTYAKYPARMKLTSKRKLKYLKQILPPTADVSDAVLVAQDTSEEETIVTRNFYATAQRRSFAEKAEALPSERKEWLAHVLSLLDNMQGISARRGMQAITYLMKGKPLAKITVSRRYTYVYLAVDPARYADKKYGVKDASSVKKYAKYPARLKLTSRRKLKYLEQMLNERSTPSV